MRLDERTPGNLNTRGHIIGDKSLKYLIHDCVIMGLLFVVQSSLIHLTVKVLMTVQLNILVPIYWLYVTTRLVYLIMHFKQSNLSVLLVVLEAVGPVLI